MPSDPTDLDELDRLEKAATPGPWRIEGPLFDEWIGRGDGTRIVEGSVDCGDADLALIVHTRNALPGLIRELREARELLRSAEHGLSSSEDTDEGWLSAAIPLIGDIRAHLDKHTKKETTDAE